MSRSEEFAAGHGFYHGTSEPLTKAVLPASAHGGPKVFQETDPDFAYATTDRRTAFHYSLATSTRMGGVGRVYRVEPLGEYEPDMQIPNSYRSKAGWKILGVERD